MLTLEVPLEPMRTVAAAAKEVGTIVCFKPSPLTRVNRASALQLLADEVVSWMFVKDTELMSLLDTAEDFKEIQKQMTIQDVEIGMAMALDMWPMLDLIVVRSNLGTLLRRRSPQNALATIGVGGGGMGTVASAMMRVRRQSMFIPSQGLVEARDEEDEEGGGDGKGGGGEGSDGEEELAKELVLLLPAREQVVSRLPDGRLGSVIGAADAFFAGFVAARCRRLSEAQAMIWAMSTAALCAVYPEAQIRGDASLIAAVTEEELPTTPIRHVLSAQYAVSYPLPPSVTETALPSGSALLPPTFMLQNTLHLAALRVEPALLHRVVSQQHSASPSVGAEVRSDLTRLLLEKDATGLVPLQRAYVCMQLLSKRDSPAIYSRCRRVLRWLIAARIILVATGDAPPLLPDTGMTEAASKAEMADTHGETNTEGVPTEAEGGDAPFWGTAEKAVSQKAVSQSHDRLEVVRAWATGFPACPSEGDIIFKHQRHIFGVSMEAAVAPFGSAHRGACVVLSLLGDVSTQQRDAVTRQVLGKRSIARAESTFDVNSESAPSATNVAAAAGAPSSYKRTAMARARQQKMMESDDSAELQLVLACCMPALQEVIDTTTASALVASRNMSRRGSLARRESRRHVLTKDRAVLYRQAFSLALIEASTPQEHNSLLILAAGAGQKELVSAALDLMDRTNRGNRCAPNVHGETALHTAACGHSIDVCRVVLERTSLQLQGPAAKTVDGRTPLEMCFDPFRSQLDELRFSCTYAAFLSHYKLETASEARLFKSGLEARLDGGREVFLDSDNLSDLNQLKRCVCSSDVFIFIQSPGVLSRPWCLLELCWAISACKPIVAIRVDGLSAGKYDYGEVDTFMANLAANLDQVNPEAARLLKEHSISLSLVGPQLRHVLQTIVSIPYNTGWSSRMFEAMLDDVHETMKQVEPVQVAVETHTATCKLQRALRGFMDTRRVLGQWTAILDSDLNSAQAKATTKKAAHAS